MSVCREDPVRRGRVRIAQRVLIVMLVILTVTAGRYEHSVSAARLDEAQGRSPAGDRISPPALRGQIDRAIAAAAADGVELRVTSGWRSRASRSACTRPRSARTAHRWRRRTGSCRRIVPPTSAVRRSTSGPVPEPSGSRTTARGSVCAVATTTSGGTSSCWPRRTAAAPAHRANPTPALMSSAPDGRVRRRSVRGPGRRAATRKSLRGATSLPISRSNTRSARLASSM